MLRKLIVELLIPAVFLAMLALLLKWLIVPSYSEENSREHSVYGAPLPLPKAPAKVRTVKQLTVRDMEGSWVLDWNGSDWRMTLNPGGDYLCTSAGGSEWVGRWWPDAFGRLCVSESVLVDGAPGASSEWVIHWAYVLGRLTPTRLLGEARYNSGNTVPITMRRPKKGE